MLLTVSSLLCFGVLLPYSRGAENEESVTFSLDALIDSVLGGDPSNISRTLNTPRAVTVDTTTIATTTSTRSADQPCTCVPYYLCHNGTISTDGSASLDPRLGPQCGDSQNICCKEPPVEKPILPPLRERKGCGQRNPQGVDKRITGTDQNQAKYAEFPWMVAVLKITLDEDDKQQKEYVCGGALIHTELVLTTAHWIFRLTKENLRVRAGEWDTQTVNEIFPHQERTVNSMIIHDDFQPGNLGHNYALLRIDSGFNIGTSVDTVCLPQPATVPSSKDCFVTGWGKHAFGAHQRILKKIDVPIIPREECQNLFRQKTKLGKYFVLHKTVVCAGGVPGKDACSGDGGSPLVCPTEGNPDQYEATGLVSWGIGCGSVIPGAYADVGYARSWIDVQMSQLGLQLEKQ